MLCLGFLLECQMSVSLNFRSDVSQALQNNKTTNQTKLSAISTLPMALLIQNVSPPDPSPQMHFKSWILYKPFLSASKSCQVLETVTQCFSAALPNPICPRLSLNCTSARNCHAPLLTKYPSLICLTQYDQSILLKMCLTVYSLAKNT